MKDFVNRGREDTIWIGINKYLLVFSDTKADVVFFDSDVVVFSRLLESNLPRLLTDSDCYPFVSHENKIADSFKKSKDIFICLCK